MAALSSLQILINIAAIVFGFVQNSNSSTFDINARTEGDSVYTRASHFTVEAFNCALEQYAPDEKRGTFGQICTEGVSLFPFSHTFLPSPQYINQLT